MVGRHETVIALSRFLAPTTTTFSGAARTLGGESGRLQICRLDCLITVGENRRNRSVSPVADGGHWLR
jgi:hypothetical protein